MQHVSDVLTRMLNDSARRNRTNLSQIRNRPRSSQGSEDTSEFSNSLDSSDIRQADPLTPDNHLSTSCSEPLCSEENRNPTSSRCLNCNDSTPKQSCLTQEIQFTTSSSHISDRHFEETEGSSGSSGQATDTNFNASVAVPCTSKCSDDGYKMNDYHETLPERPSAIETTEACSVFTSTVDGKINNEISNTDRLVLVLKYVLLYYCLQNKVFIVRGN